jgi:murein L,D-transpeptidase YcbB/YkuD
VLAGAVGVLPALADEPARGPEPPSGQIVAPPLTMPTSPPAVTLADTAVTTTTEEKAATATAGPNAEPASVATVEPQPKPLSPLAEAIARRIAAIAPSVATSERSAIAAAYQARAHEPIWTGKDGLSAPGRALAAELHNADDWGLKGADFDVPQPAERASEELVADTEIRLTLALLKYARHARGGRFDPTQLSNYIDRKPPLLEPKRVLDEIAAATEPDAYLRGLHPRHPQFEALRQKYLALRSGAAPAEPTPAPADRPQAKGKKPAAASSPSSNLRRVLLNMEQWRWMPEDLGTIYVWVNIPEFTLRLVRDGKVVHSERVITGKPDNQTPIFSEQMASIVFHPFWGVPDSIKVKEILPSLLRGGNVLERNGLRLQSGGRDIDHQSVDWSTVDIRRFHVYQPPGGANVLGVVKFLFPNKHDVYMHDTPTKDLFNATQRTFSHGCMRLRNPLQLAEAILAADKGWSKDHVYRLAGPGAQQNNQVHLTTKVPVHVTYFTAFANEDGRLDLRPDIYGHEERIQMGLDGKAHLIVKRKDDLRAEVISRLAEARARSSTPNWMRAIFGFSF